MLFNFASAISDAPVTVPLGIASALLGVAVLFLIKPRLVLTFDPQKCWFLIENRCFSRVVRVEARLWVMKPVGDNLWSRDPVPMRTSRLFELNGLWGEYWRSSNHGPGPQGDRFYRFASGTDDCTHADDRRNDLRERLARIKAANGKSEDQPHLLFHIWCEHGFTNIGRVHKIRITDVEEMKVERSKFALRPISAVAAWLLGEIASENRDAGMREVNVRSPD